MCAFSKSASQKAGFDSDSVTAISVDTARWGVMNKDDSTASAALVAQAALAARTAWDAPASAGRCGSQPWG